MSGGSFNYAYTATDLYYLLEKQADWQDLAEAFEAIDADDVAAEINAMLKYVNLAGRRVETRLKRLREVAQAMEWWQSNDSYRQWVDDAIAKYRKEDGPAE